MLSAKELLDSRSNGKIEFSGQFRGDSLLLTLGSTVQFFADDNLVIDPFDQASLESGYSNKINKWKEICIKSGQLVLCSVDEYLRFDHSHFGFITTLSHVARFGLMTQPSSFVVNPNFEGHLTLELFNLCPHTLKLTYKMPVAKLLIFECKNCHPIQESDIHRKKSYYGSSDDLRSRFYEEFGKT